MAEPTNTFADGEEVKSSLVNQNFIEALNNYRDFTYGETIAVNDALYLKASDGKVYKTDADFDDERIHNFVGFAKEAGNANDVKKVQIGGKVSGFSELTIGVDYYLSNTAGAISSSIGTYKKRIGFALSTTEILLIHEDRRFLEYIEIEPAGWSAANNSGIWEDWNLSALIPVGAKYAEIGLFIPGYTTKLMGVRKNGSTIDRYLAAFVDSTSVGGLGLTMTVELDANRIVERYQTDKTNGGFTVLGYWK